MSKGLGMYYLYGYSDSMFLVEYAVMVLTPWLCLAAMLLADRIWRGRFDARRSYFATTGLVAFLFLAIPLHCLCIGWQAALKGAFELSAMASLLFLSLNYVVERFKDKLEQGG